MATVTLTCGSATVNVLAADLELVRRGPWVAHVESSGDSTFAELAPAVLTIAGEVNGTARSFAGTVRRSRPWQERTRTVIVGGAGKLRDALPPVDHVGSASTGVAALLVAQGIADASGEVLAPSVASALEGFAVPHWTRAGADALGSGGTAIDGFDALVFALAELSLDPSWTWRTQADGLIWIGADTFPAYSGDPGNLWIDDGDDGRIDAAPPIADLLPGVSVLGHPIERVTYRIGGTTARAELLYPVSGDVSGRRVPDVYQQSHGATSVLQHDDGTLDLVCDDPRLGASLRFVPFDCGIPGASLTIPDGSRVDVAFRDGSPQGVYAFALAQDRSAARPVARVGDSGIAGTLAIVTGTAPGAPCPITYTAPGGLPVVFPGGVVNLAIEIRTGSEEISIR